MTAHAPAASGKLLIQQACELAPRLRERAEATDKRGWVSDDIVQELRAAGLWRLQKPARYGGFQLGYDTVTDVLIELARGCASTAWMTMILNSGGIVAGFREQAQDELWGDGLDRVACGVFSPVLVEAVAGGYQLTGTWSFASGIEHADWLFLGGLVRQDGTPTDMRFCLLPKTEIRIVDDWQVIGLRATASKTVVAEQLYVPEHRTLSMALLRAGQAPGAALHDTWLYRIPLAAVYHTTPVGVAIGAAHSAYEWYREWTKTRRGRDGRPLAEHVETQIHLAECAAEIEGAERIIRTDVAEVMRLAEGGYDFSVEERARYRRDAAFCHAPCVRAVDRLFEQSGASGIHDGHPVQRIWRDLHAGAAHHSNRWDDAMAHFGHVAFGPGTPQSFFY